MGTRVTQETLYVRYDFDQTERLEMGSSLADAYNRKQQIEEQEKRAKAQFAEQKSGVEATIGSLSRSLGTGWEMRNIPCTPRWDFPNVGEVTYFDAGGREIKHRAMTETERQMDLPLEETAPQTDAEAEASVAASQDNVDTFFGRSEEEEPPEGDDGAQEPPERDEDEEETPEPVAAGKSGPAELKAYHEEQLTKESKRGRPKKTQVN